MKPKNFLEFIRSHILLFSGLILLVFVTVVLVITAFNIQSTSEVEICIAPASATIKINDQTYTNGTYRLPAGEISVHIEKENFITRDFIFDTTKSQKLYTYLTQTDDTYSWYESHESDALLLTKIGDYESVLTAKSYTEKHPIVSILPIIYASYDENYNYTEFRIDGGNLSDCDSDFCLKITDTTGGNLDAAKKMIKDAGFNPDDYQTFYTYAPIKELN